jgi:hypothetical protein
MKTELTLLYGEVVVGEVPTLEEFRQRLEAIESLEPGIVSDDNIGRALRAFSSLEREAPSRHHQLELLSEALGIV